MFITLEGPEGSGKTTAVDYAVSKLEKMGYQISIDTILNQRERLNNE